MDGDIRSLDYIVQINIKKGSSVRNKFHLKGLRSGVLVSGFGCEGAIDPKPLNP